MRILKIVLSFILSVVVIGVLVYFLTNVKIVKFNVEEQKITKRSLKMKYSFLNEPDIKLKDDYKVEGWYLDKEFENEWIFEVDKVTKNTKLYAHILKSINVSIYDENTLTNDFLYLDYKEYEPIKLGHKFKGLYLDKELENKLDYKLTKEDEGIKLYEKWELETRELPVLTIDLKDGVLMDDVDKEDYIKSNINLFNVDDQEHELKDVLAEFRGRGNSSWDNFDKKGYKIKFDKKTPLFGRAKNKHWVLVAEAYDTSFSKNKVAYTLANKVLTNIEYTTPVYYLDVYVNNEYRGVYLLLEHKRVGTGRVDIESEYNELDTGYLLEYDARANNENNENGIDYFNVKGLRHPFLVKSPKPKNYESKGEMTEEEFRDQIDFIKDYMQDAVDKIMSGKKEDIDELVDIDSVVDMYLLQEFVKNYDSGWSSQYMYKKPSGKLYFGPGWDFDITAGSNYLVGLKSYKGIYVGSNLSLQPVSHKNQIYIRLMKEDWFKELVKNRLNELKDEIIDEIDNIYDDIFSYEKSFELNYFRWPEITKAKIDPKNYLSEQEEAKEWYGNRLEWLINYFN